MTDRDITYRLLDTFDAEQFSPAVWNSLLSSGSTDVIFMTWKWQKVWWEVFGRGKLLIIVAEENYTPIAIAPLFADADMIFFVGSGGSDYLDFIGNIKDEDILWNMLLLAKLQVPGFLGFRFYHLPDASHIITLLTELAKRESLYYCNEGEMPAPVLELKKFPEQAGQAIRKKSLLRHEAWFNRNDGIEIQHFDDNRDILPYLDDFFEQHTKRWEQTPFPGLFNDPLQRIFFKRLSEALTATCWLRFTRIVWHGNAVAFHFGVNYKGSFLWYKPSFDITLARHSPGEVLLRQLLLQALHEKAHSFDFGLGDEDFKKRFATSTIKVQTWGLYPYSSVKEDSYEKYTGH